MVNLQQENCFAEIGDVSPDYALQRAYAFPRPTLLKPAAAGTPTCSRLIRMSSIAPKVGTKIAVIWIAITIASVGASAIFAAASLADSVSRAARKAEILLAGAPDRGIFDPSIAGDGRRLYMTVSGVSSKAAGSGLGVTAVRSYLARSQDQGRTWQLVGGAVNPDVEASLDDRRAGSSSGISISTSTASDASSMAGWPIRRPKRRNSLPRRDL